MNAAKDRRILQLTELNELSLFSYKNAKLFQEKKKRWHDKHIQKKKFEIGQQVLLFNSRLKLFSEKLKSKWSRLFTIVQVLPYRVVSVKSKDAAAFKINGHRFKQYWGGDIVQNTSPIILVNAT